MVSIERFKGIAKEGTWNWARYQAERLGKKVKLSTWNDGVYIKFASVNYYDELGHKAWLNPTLFDADDWEVVDEDKDWNLASKHKGYANPPNQWSFEHKDVKKCRDLIISKINDAKYRADDENKNIRYGLELAAEFVDETFGDLK